MNHFTKWKKNTVQRSRKKEKKGALKMYRKRRAFEYQNDQI